VISDRLYEKGKVTLLRRGYEGISKDQGLREDWARKLWSSRSEPGGIGEAEQQSCYSTGCSREISNNTIA
jgi:hypothetical protein